MSAMQILAISMVSSIAFQIFRSLYSLEIWWAISFGVFFLISLFSVLVYERGTGRKTRPKK